MQGICVPGICRRPGSCNPERTLWYCPFDDSVDGWQDSRWFVNWYHGRPLGLHVRSFNVGNILAREHPDKYAAWAVLRRMKGGKP